MFSLAGLLASVLRSLIFHECRVPARDGRWFAVRIMPYRTQDNRIDGVVITFLDITLPKTQEDTLREALAARVPALIHVRVGEMPSPWDMLALPRVRGFDEAWRLNLP